MAALYGLIGYPLTHSFSPDFFNRKFNEEGIDALYKAFPIASIEEFPALLTQEPTLRGVNVTIPYKESVLSCLDEIDEVASLIGAVNCIIIKNGKTKGYNTDVIGFENSLVPLLHPVHGHALVLGTGGASRAVKHVLSKLHIPFQMVSRTKAAGVITYEELTPEMVADHKLIINTTPLGMYPAIDGCPLLPYASIGVGHLLYDLIYNPEETLFLSKGKANGAGIKNGLEMLHLQALTAWDIWCGK